MWCAPKKLEMVERILMSKGCVQIVVRVLRVLIGLEGVRGIFKGLKVPNDLGCLKWLSGSHGI